MFSSDLAWGEAVVIGAMDVLCSHGLVVHLHNVAIVSRGISFLILVRILQGLKILRGI